jgi:hypothetical protein
MVIDYETEDVWPRIVAHGVKVELGFGQQGAIKLGNENDFIFKVRPGKKLAKGIDDAASAA